MLSGCSFFVSVFAVCVLFVCLTVCVLFVCFVVCVFVCMSVFLFTCLFVCLFVSVVVVLGGGGGDVTVCLYAYLCCCLPVCVGVRLWSDRACSRVRCCLLICTVDSFCCFVFAVDLCLSVALLL